MTRECDRMKCTCGEKSFELDKERYVICSACKSKIDVRGWETIVMTNIEEHVIINTNAAAEYAAYNQSKGRNKR